MSVTTVEPYGATLHLATSKKQWKRLSKTYAGGLHKSGRQALGSSTLLLSERGDAVLVVWVDVRAHRDARELMRTAVHEAVHASAALLEQVHQPYDSTSEALAYLVDWMSAWLWDALGDHLPK